MEPSVPKRGWVKQENRTLNYVQYNQLILVSQKEKAQGIYLIEKKYQSVVLIREILYSYFPLMMYNILLLHFMLQLYLLLY